MLESQFRRAIDYRMLVLVSALAPVFFIIGAGFFIRRKGILSAEADATLLRIVLNVLYPCLILSTIVGNPALRQALNVWLPPLIGFFTVAAGYVLCYAAARLLRIASGRQTRTFVYVTALYNYTYTAIPLVQKLFGAKTLGVLFTHNLGVEIAFWLGVSLILTPRADASGSGVLRRILSMPVLAIVVALILNFSGAGDHLPGFVLDAVRMLGGAAIPLALLLTGATLDDFLEEMRPTPAGAVALAGACVLRLGALPLLFLALARWLPCSVELRQVLLIQGAMPCAMMPVLLARHFGGDAPMAVQIVFGTTLLGILTIPLWIHFGMLFVSL